MSDPKYGRAHRALRLQITPLVEAGGVKCWRCDQYIVVDYTRTDRGWHLGHDDTNPTIYRGAEHAHCNTSAAGKIGAAIIHNKPTTQHQQWEW